MTHTLTIPGNPVPWQRTRTRNGQFFTAARTRAFQDLLKLEMRRYRIFHPFDNTKITKVACYFVRATRQRTDIDNLIKTIFDAGNGWCWKDDSQIDNVRAIRLVDKKNPRTIVEFE